MTLQPLSLSSFTLTHSYFHVTSVIKPKELERASSGRSQALLVLQNKYKTQKAVARSAATLILGWEGSMIC
jgi:hypothetical protein